MRNSKILFIFAVQLKTKTFKIMSTSTKPFKGQIKDIRNTINEKLISLLKKYNTKQVDCVEFGDCPIIIYNSNCDKCYTLDCINLNKDNITFDCSSSYSNDSVALLDMDIELLIDVYEWVKENEEELFEDVE